MTDQLTEDPTPDCPECGRPGDLAVRGIPNRIAPDYHCLYCDARFDEGGVR